MFRITAKESIYFDLFIETTDIICKAAKMLEDLMENYENIPKKIEAIESIEHECDQHVHKIMSILNASFITPIDREDIYLIAKELDNIVDEIEATAHRFRMFNVKSMNEDAIKLAKLISQSSGELKNVMVDLKNLKKSSKLKEKIIEVNRIENQGDDIYRNAITKLFVEQKDPIEVIIWKEIFEYLENTLDVCEDVANIVEGVVMKHA
jgi:uncharacterized protein